MLASTVNVVFGSRPNHDITEELTTSTFRAAQQRQVGQLGAARLQWEVAELAQVADLVWRVKLRWLGEVDKEDVHLFMSALSLVVLMGSSHCRVDCQNSST